MKCTDLGISHWPKQPDVMKNKCFITPQQRGRVCLYVELSLQWGENSPHSKRLTKKIIAYLNNTHNSLVYVDIKSFTSTINKCKQFV